MKAPRTDERDVLESPALNDVVLWCAIGVLLALSFIMTMAAAWLVLVTA